MWIILNDETMPIAEGIKDLMTTNIISMDDGVKITEVIKKMVDRAIGSIVVKRDNELVGIVTERDILKIINKENIYSSNLTVGKIMSSPLITIEANASAGKAIKIMEANGIRRLLVEEDGKMVGIVTQKDIIREASYVFGTLLSRD